MKILAIASAGGHWVQLLRLLPAFEKDEMIFLTTQSSLADTVKGNKFYFVPDANRSNRLKLAYMSCRVFMVVFSQKPQVIITTGAAPGLLGIIAGKMIGAKTIWIDSIANVEKISMSGRIALRFADKVFSQWPDLQTSKIEFHGNILS